MATGFQRKSLGRRVRERIFRRPLRHFRCDFAGRGRTLLVRMDVTNCCNMRCRMCPYASTDRRGTATDIMDLALFSKTADQVFRHAYHLALSCAYEPLLHPQLPRILEIASGHDVPEWGLVTNASLLDEPTAEAMIRHEMKVLSVSIDGTTPETYRDIRGVDAFDKVLQNVRRLQAMKREAGSELPRLLLNFVLMRRNLAEVVPFLRLGRELGAVDVTFVHVSPRSRDNPESLIHAPEQYAHVYEEARRLADESPMQVLLPAPFRGEELAAIDRDDRERRLQQTRTSDLRAAGAETTSATVEEAGDDIYCASPWVMLLISPNGDVHPCSHRRNEPPLGNLGSTSFEDIWNGPANLALRRQLYYHDLKGLCRTCEALTPNSEPLVHRPIRILR